MKNVFKACLSLTFWIRIVSSTDIVQQLLGKNDHWKSILKSVQH